jgi:hypothetical protein
MKAKALTLSTAMSQPELFGPYFNGPSWNTWKAVAAVAARQPPTKRVKEVVVAAGRGAGKDSVASLIMTVAAVNFDPRRATLRPGEHAICMALACDRHQAAILFNYRGYFEQIPALAEMVINVGADSIELANRVKIEIHTNSFRAVRGRSILCAVLDECAFFRDESFASPDIEIDAALSPGLARVQDSIKILISSVHKRSGLLY